MACSELNCLCWDLFKKNTSTCEFERHSEYKHQMELLVVQFQIKEQDNDDIKYFQGSYMMYYQTKLKMTSSVPQ